MTTNETQCAAWRGIYYSARGDTPKTIREVQVHNLTGKKLGCWK